MCFILLVRPIKKVSNYKPIGPVHGVKIFFILQTTKPTRPFFSTQRLPKKRTLGGLRTWTPLRVVGRGIMPPSPHRWIVCCFPLLSVGGGRGAASGADLFWPDGGVGAASPGVRGCGECGRCRRSRWRRGGSKHSSSDQERC